MSNKIETVSRQFASIPEEILFKSFEAYKKIKDLVLVDEYGAFRPLDKEHWNQLGVLAKEGFNLSSKNWGMLLSKIENFQEKQQEDQADFTELVKEMEVELQRANAQYEVLLKSKESLAVSMERLLAELVNFSVPRKLRKPGDPDFAIPEKGVNLWIEAVKATIGLRSRSLLTQFLVRYNRKYVRSKVLFDKIMSIQEETQSESDAAVKKAKENTIKQIQSILFGVEEFQHRRSLITPLQKAVEEFELELEEFQRKIYNKAKNEHSTLEFVELLEDFSGWQMEHIPNFAEVQVKTYFLQQLLYQQNNKSDAKRIGRVAAVAGSIKREALSSFAAAMVLRVHALGVSLSGSKAKLFGFPASYKFQRPIPDGKLTKVTELEGLAADKLIEIRGFVKIIETFRDSDNKLISRLILEESQEGALFAAEAIFLHLRHEGIAPGAYCHIQAFVRDPISFEGNEIPRLLIDRLSIKSELISQSWKMAFLDLSFPYYERWPNGINLKYSLSPHHPDEEDANNKLGAAELGFKSMVN